MFAENNELIASELQTFLLVYVLQHLVFLIARVPIFALFMFFTCCCDKGVELKEDLDGQVVEMPLFKDHIISYDYIEWQLDANHRFENHAVGIEEF